jgi:hypothetical protein
VDGDTGIGGDTAAPEFQLQAALALTSALTGRAFGRSLVPNRRTPEMDDRKPASEQQAKPGGIPIQGACAIAGAVICVVLNVVTDGWVPGGYAAGVIGGTIGWLFGIGLEKFLASRQ